MIPADWKKKTKESVKARLSLETVRANMDTEEKKKKLSAEYSEVIKKRIASKAFRKCRDHYRLQI